MATADDSQWNLLPSTLMNAWTLFNCSTQRQWWRLWRDRRVWICMMTRQRVIKFNTHCSERLSENCSTSLEWDQIWCSRQNACHTNLRHQLLQIWHVPRKCWDIWKEHENWISTWRYLHWNQITWTRPWNTSRDIQTLTGLVIQWRGRAHLAHCVTLINFSALSAELIFAQAVLKDIGLSFLIHARADSSTALAVATQQGASRKMKHTRFLRLKTSTLTRERLERGEEEEILLGKSDEWHSPTQLQDDSTRDDAEARKDFWCISGDFIYHHHVEPRVELYMPKGESFLSPLKFIDGTRNTHTSLDVMLEKSIDDYWNVDGVRDLSDMWTGMTRFTLLERGPPDGYTWSVGDWRENKRPPGRTNYGQKYGNTCQMHLNVKKSKDGISKNQNSVMPEDYVVFIHWSHGWGMQQYHEKC